MEVLACDIYILADFFKDIWYGIRDMHRCKHNCLREGSQKRPQRDTWTIFLDEIPEGILNDTKEYFERFS